MLTQCPNCQTTFRVTSEILRVADGQVRCGRCQTQFDALERLIEENDAGEVQSGRYLRPSRSRPETSSDKEVDAPGNNHIEFSGEYEALDSSDIDEPAEHGESVEEWVDIDAPDETDPRDDETDDVENEEAPEDELEDEDADYAEDDAEVRNREALEDEALIAAAAAKRIDTLDTQGHDAGPDVEPDFDLFAPAPRRTVSKVWTALAAPLVLLLAVQLIHHNRAELARHPRVGAPLMNAYEALGMSLTPDWNLHAYEVRQWGVVSDPSTPGTLRVRASITNIAEFPQPYPLFKLVLEDRWGDQVRAREFDPSEYLDPGVAPERLMAPSQKANATITIVDPGPDAEGFRFDVCLRGRRGTVCAAEMRQ